MNRHDVINFLIELYGYRRYLEIGVRSRSLSKIRCGHRDGVDPKPKDAKANFEMTSDEFFGQLDDKTTYDVIFIDGLHTEAAVDKDVQNGLKHLARGGTLVLHDCNPISESRQCDYEIYRRNRGPWNGTVWRSFAKLRRTRTDLSMYTVDTDEGIGILRPGEQKLFEWEGELVYEVLEQNRAMLLNLIPVDKFKEIEQRRALR